MRQSQMNITNVLEWKTNSIENNENNDAYNEFEKHNIKNHTEILQDQNFDEIYLLGKGSQGYVYSLRDSNLQRFAMKVIKIKEQGNKIQPDYDQAISELNILNLCQGNPYVIKLIYSKEHSDYMLLGFPQCQMTLSTALLKGSLSENQIIKISKDIVEGISYIQKINKKILVNDIKPDNILIDMHGNAVISDFGLAKLLRQDSSNTKNPVGNFLYCAPEILQQDQRQESAWYSIGLIIIEMIMGHQQIQKILRFKSNSVDISDFPSNYTYENELKEVIKGLTKLDPKERTSLAQIKFILKGIYSEIMELEGVFDQHLNIEIGQQIQDAFEYFKTSKSTYIVIPKSKNSLTKKQSQNVQMKQNELNSEVFSSQQTSILSQQNDKNEEENENGNEKENENENGNEYENENGNENKCDKDDEDDDDITKLISYKFKEKKGYKRIFLQRANFYLNRIDPKIKWLQGIDIINDKLIRNLETHFIIQLKDYDLKVYPSYEIMNKQNTVCCNKKYRDAQRLSLFVQQVKSIIK